MHSKVTMFATLSELPLAAADAAVGSCVSDSFSASEEWK
jgi:hypothetical protein